MSASDGRFRPRICRTIGFGACLIVFVSLVQGVVLEEPQVLSPRKGGAAANPADEGDAPKRDANLYAVTPNPSSNRAVPSRFNPTLNHSGKGRSYYSPGGSITVDSTIGPFEAPIEISGEIRDMIVACDLGRFVYGFVGGKLAWRQEYPQSWPRAIAMFENQLFCADGQKIEIINPYSGHRRHVLEVPGAPSAINGISLVRYKDHIWMILCFDQEGPGAVRGYHLDGFQLKERFVNPHSAMNPRHAELGPQGWLFICDTFGHRVYAVTLSGRMEVRNEVYFPNHVQVLSDHAVLITAEHENRVIQWTYSPVERRELVMCAPVAPFNSIHATCVEIIVREAETINPHSPLSPPKSLCALESSGPCTLYSPNSARLIGDELLVADTDNHRVVLFREGAPVMTISGLNNPVTAIPISHQDK